MDVINRKYTTMKTYLLTFLLFMSCQHTFESDPPVQDSNIPEGAIFNERFVERPTPPSDFYAGIIWFQAATLTHNQSSSDSAMIIIDYMKWFEKDKTTGVETIIGEEHYNESPPRPLNNSEGGLYNRRPTWFSGESPTHPDIDASIIQDGFLFLDISRHPDWIYHWWCRKYSISHNNKTYGYELRIKIIGKTSIQAGMDWWRTLESPWAGLNVNNRLAFAGNWHGQTNNNFIIIKETL